MADKATPQQPIVVLVNYGRYSDDVIDVNSVFTKLVYGVSPRGFGVDLPTWYFGPEEDDLWDIIQERRDLSLEVVEEWVKSEEFGTYVAERLLEEIKKEAASDDIDPETVKVILLEDHIAKLTKPVHQALTTLFPNAVFCNDQGDKLSHLSSVQLTELQLSGRVREALRYNSRILNVGQLVEKTEAEVLAIPEIGKKALEEIKTALKEQGLALQQG